MDCRAKEKIIVALDVQDCREMHRVLDSLEGRAVWCKIGMELFTREGPAAVGQARARGLQVFLDLKFHDIPNTVAGGIRSALELGIGMVTIHLGGGNAMISRAVEAAAGSQTTVLGVSVLTSASASTLAETGVTSDPPEQVARLVRLGAAAKIGGIVCSPLEIHTVREIVGRKCLIVTPGVRPAGADHGDQSRVLTPGDAIRSGSDFLVIGRPILAAPDPANAFEAIESEVADAMARTPAPKP